MQTSPQTSALKKHHDKIFRKNSTYLKNYISLVSMIILKNIKLLILEKYNFYETRPSYH
jgi:hypothetical protein